jgi:hypothetical protein
MLDRYIVIEDWLAAEPHLSAVDILSRLEEQASGRFCSRQLRTVQRLVKNRRSKSARQLISSAEVTPTIDPRPIFEVLMPTKVFA